MTAGGQAEEAVGVGRAPAKGEGLSSRQESKVPE